MASLEIIRKTFTNCPKDGRGFNSIELPYIPVYQGGYGRMDKTTPSSGLVTSGVASCTCVVLHCQAKGRTVLTHSPNFMCIDRSFMPIFRWLVCDPGFSTGWPSVEAVVLRGFMYGDPLNASVYGHTSWMADFRAFVTTLPCKVNIVDEKQLVTSGSLLVDKGTGKITIIESDHLVRVINDSLPQNYLNHQSYIDMFVSNIYMIIASSTSAVPADLHLQYDLNKYNLPMPLSSGMRRLLRSKFMGEPEKKQVDLIKAIPMLNWLNSSTSVSVGMRAAYMSIVNAGMPCELCHLKGIHKCSKCKGAWYCGKEHQSGDWKSHKTWCKANALEVKTPVKTSVTK